MLRFLSSVVFRKESGKSKKGVHAETVTTVFCIRFHLDSFWVGQLSV